ncbi:MAG TPA: efflux RND transporter periplasmic adaptor subunit [Steroidobacteraceae bacterium]|nr:efflux RND transporter periplasmic adaptor subunit [Steroidobacteraceae bacterium]
MDRVVRIDCERQDRQRQRIRLAVPAVAALLVLYGCGESAGPPPAGPRPVPVVTAVAQERPVEVTEETVGRLDAVSVPLVAAETSGRVVRILRDAGDTVAADEVLAALDDRTQRLEVESARAAIERLRALVENQALTVRRFEDLAQEQSVSQSLLDQARAERVALEAQLREARARLADAQLALARTEIRSPAPGTLQRRLVSVGDFVHVGDPVFELVSPALLQAFLPFPERLIEVLEPGQRVRLEVPSQPGRTTEGRITELRPMVGAGNRAIEAIVNLDNPGGWRPGSSVNGTVVLETREAIVIPAIGVVRRPAGEVVYVVEGDIVAQRVVDPGIRNGALVEIRSGIAAGETVVADGAGFLTDSARVVVREP